MAKGHNADEKDSSFIGRRPTLQTIGGLVGMAALPGISAAASASPDTDEVVDLGEKGLRNGDVIDGYLKQYFEDGVEVRIPEGEYEWHCEGFQQASSNAAIVGEGEVILVNEGGQYRQNIRATGGTLAFKNLTIRKAARGSYESRFRLETTGDAQIVVDNFDLPDGVEEDHRGQGFYVPPRHAGRIEIRNCYIANFGDNGIYGCPPGMSDGNDGTVVVENTVTRNNNIAGIRLGSSGSAARNCLVINDGRAPYQAVGVRNQRGIRIRQPGNDVTIEDCEVVHSYSGAGGPVVFHNGAEGGSGSLRNVRIQNETSTDAILEKGSAAANWSAAEVSITGDGSYTYPSHFSGVATGDGDEPTEEDPQNSDYESDRQRLEVRTSADLAEYEITVDGEAEPGYDANTHDHEYQDSVTTEDGVSVIHGYVGSSGVDDFSVDGTVVDAKATESVSITLDGETVDVDELSEESTDTTESDEDGSTSDEDGTTDSEENDTTNSDEEDSASDGTDTDVSEPRHLELETSGGVAEYEITVDGDAAPGDDANTHDHEYQDSVTTKNGISVIHGYVGSSGTDDFYVDGTIAAAEATEPVTATLDGETIDLDELPEEPLDTGESDGDDTEDSDDDSTADSPEKILLIDGTLSDTVTSYAFRVTGEVERDAGLSSVEDGGTAWDNLEDSVDDERVVGSVGKGIDGYRYTGNLVEFKFDGHASVTVNDS